MQDTVKMSLIDNLFESNFAIKIENSNIAAKLSPKGMAGGLYYACEIADIFYLSASDPDYLKKCIVELSGTNNFTNNSAHDGGAIMWIKDRPVFSSNTTIFS